MKYYHNKCFHVISLKDINLNTVYINQISENTQYTLFKQKETDDDDDEANVSKYYIK